VGNIVKLSASAGCACALCEKDIPTGDPVVSVTAKIKVGFFPIDQVVEVHANCAADLMDDIEQVLKKIRRK